MGNIERKILQLKQDEGTIVDEANLKVLITENTNKFGAPALNYFAMMDELIVISNNCLLIKVLF